MAAAADGDFPSSILSEDYQVAARRTIGGTAALSETIISAGADPWSPRAEAPAQCVQATRLAIQDRRDLIMLAQQKRSSSGTEPHKVRPPADHGSP
jgi:hypothetical protein